MSRPATQRQATRVRSPDVRSRTSLRLNRATSFESELGSGNEVHAFLGLAFCIEDPRLMPPRRAAPIPASADGRAARRRFGAPSARQRICFRAGLLLAPTARSPPCRGLLGPPSPRTRGRALIGLLSTGSMARSGSQLKIGARSQQSGQILFVVGGPCLRLRTLKLRHWVSLAINAPYEVLETRKSKARA